MAERLMPERKRVKDALRALGLTARQTDALMRDGWKGLVGASKAEAAELRDRLAELQSALRR